MQSTVTLYPGDNRISLQRLIDDGVRVHSVVTDPPYGLVSVQKRFGKEGSAAARTEGNDGSFARLSGGFMGKCFHPDTEILTASGWMKVDKIEVGDIVATLNPISRSTEWQAVAQTHAYPFDGDLVHVKHRSAEQMVTPNHKVLVSHDGGESLDLLTPRELKNSFHLFAQSAPQIGRNDDVIIRSVRAYGKDRVEYRTEEARFSSSAFFRFFGLWLGDGYCVVRSDDHPANDFFGINVKKKRKVDAVRSALRDLGIKFTESLGASGFTAFYCYNFALLGWLKLLGGAKEKHIPTFLFEWDAAQLDHLYQGLMDSDGCRQGKNQEVFQTSSRQLADDFQRLCFVTGRSCAITLRPGGKDVVICGHKAVSSDSWVCCVLQQGKRMYGENSTTSSNVLHSVPYTGDVFCVGVPEHHIIYTRYNGKPVWSGNSWDATGIERDPDFWKLIYDILLPGGYVFAFSGSRTGHWQACAMEMAGFVMHPMHGWVFGSGFPKAHNAARAIEATMLTGGAAPKNIRQLDMGENYRPHELAGTPDYGKGRMSRGADTDRDYKDRPDLTTPEAQQWEGWAYGTQTQKPALEPIYLGQKPFSEKTGAANLLKHGVGAVNIDGCRVPAPGEAITNHSRGADSAISKGKYGDSKAQETHMTAGQALGRHPANLILDGSSEVVSMFPDSKGQQGDLKGHDKKRQSPNGVFGEIGAAADHQARNDSGSAARFFHQFGPDTDPLFYHPKAGKLDRVGSKHPTVKPIALMQYLIRHITPPGGIVLDPFAGSGTTAEAARREGFDVILMEAEQEYVDFLNQRFNLSQVERSDSLTDLTDLLDNVTNDLLV